MCQNYLPTFSDMSSDFAHVISEISENLKNDKYSENLQQNSYFGGWASPRILIQWRRPPSLPPPLLATPMVVLNVVLSVELSTVMNVVQSDVADATLSDMSVVVMNAVLAVVTNIAPSPQGRPVCRGRSEIPGTAASTQWE